MAEKKTVTHQSVRHTKTPFCNIYHPIVRAYYCGRRGVTYSSSATTKHGKCNCQPRPRCERPGFMFFRFVLVFLLQRRVFLRSLRLHRPRGWCVVVPGNLQTLPHVKRHFEEKYQCASLKRGRLYLATPTLILKPTFLTEVPDSEQRES